MDIDYHGANCVVIKSKSGTIVSDPTENVGKIKEMTNPDVTIVATQADIVSDGAGFIIDMPGEYERNDISVLGVPVKSYTDTTAKNTTMYRIVIDGIRIAIIGHATSPLSEDDLEKLGIVDVVVIPVGGGGATLNAHDASAIVRQLDPKVVIPTHYSDGSTTYKDPQDKVEEFAKELAGVAHEKLDSFKIKNSQLSPVITIYELKKKLK